MASTASAGRGDSELEQVGNLSALAGLERDVAEAERDGVVFHRAPRLAGDLGVLQVELALNAQSFVGDLAHCGRVDRADDVRRGPRVAPMDRQVLAAGPPAGDGPLKRPRGDLVLHPVNLVSRGDRGELAELGGGGDRLHAQSAPWFLPS